MNLAMVNLRVLASAGFALVTTIALFLTMKVLITGQNYEVEEELASFGIDFVRVEREEELNTKDRALKRPSQEQPDEPPPPPKLQQASRPNMDNASMSADLSGFDLGGMNLDAPVDGDALAIVRVLPRYPSRALSRGIEGWVLLEFSIDQLGRAMNPTVVEADPPGIFNSSAMRAVTKWKYRPMVENGKPAVRHGVRQLFSYEIAK